MPLPAIPIGSSLPPWPPVLATRSPGMSADFHSHHAVHFVLAMEGELAIRTSARGQWQRCAGVVTAPDTSHALKADDVELMLVFLDAESDAGAAFTRALGNSVRRLSGEERASLVNVVPNALMRAGPDHWIERAARSLDVSWPALPRVVHPRVRALLKLLRESGIDEQTSLDALASSVGLSSSRLMHVFTSSIGIPLRPYLAWLRVQRAAGAIVQGCSLTDAAHGAGFADAAHMSRTFRRMLGVPPSLLRPMRCLPATAVG